MAESPEIEQTLSSIDQEASYIENNRADRNKHYKQCMTEFKNFLKAESQQLDISEKANAQQKQLVSSAFESTFDRVLKASDLTIRKIKQTYNQKKIFWDNVIKLNADMSNLELKKQFYLQKRNAQEGYMEAVDRQKDKHKNYRALVCSDTKKEHLREYQLTNQWLQQKVVQGSNTLQQWQNASRPANKYGSYYNQQPEQRTVLNQYVSAGLTRSDDELVRPAASQIENSTVFLNNFQRRK